MTYSSDHPLSLVPIYSQLAKNILGDNFQFELSTYVYEPQAISEKRGFFTIGAKDFEETYKTKVASLRDREEIAFHSRILGANRVLHIPMIDLGCENIDKHSASLKTAFADFGISELSIFHTGRSYHVYGHKLLDSHDEALKFIGRILLLNLPGKDRVIDERWVGHRLMAGYLTLRWTNNNPHYKQMPKRIL